MKLFAVHEDSMRPALLPGDRLLAHRALLRRGDVAVFAHPFHPEVHLVKRVVAVGGDDVECRGDRLDIHREDGSAESMSLGITEPRPRRWSVLEGEAFVLSDNTSETRADSRVFGPIPLAGARRVVLRYGRRRWSFHP